MAQTAFFKAIYKWPPSQILMTKTEVCDELRIVDVCCIEEVRWKGQGARFVGTLGRRYKLWWSGNDAGFGGVGILVKEEISGNVVEVRRKSDNPCGVCGRRVMANSVLCTKCGSWVHGKCAKIKRVIARLAMHFVCSKCKGIMEGTVDSFEKLCDEVETVNGFCYLGDRLNASGGCEAAVTARVRIGWVRFRKCGKLLLGNRFPLKMKGKVYRCCVRSAILYGSETWCLKENEKAILRTESYGESHVRSESCRQKDD